MKSLNLPLSDEAVRDLQVGDPVSISGVMITGRDSVHKWMVETFIKKSCLPEGDDRDVYEAIKPILKSCIIYHCGPVVAGLDTGDYKFVAAGPTTSIREEPYQGRVMDHFNIKGVIGKGGMGEKTLKACAEVPCVYFHAIGGAATLIAQSVKKVLGVHKMDFGVPEAIWVLEVEDFPVVVTMDTHGKSIHADIEAKSKVVFDKIVA